jgi:hypothetical protein
LIGRQAAVLLLPNGRCNQVRAATSVKGTCVLSVVLD